MKRLVTIHRCFMNCVFTPLSVLSPTSLYIIPTAIYCLALTPKVLGHHLERTHLNSMGNIRNCYRILKTASYKLKGCWMSMNQKIRNPHQFLSGEHIIEHYSICKPELVTLGLSKPSQLSHDQDLYRLFSNLIAIVTSCDTHKFIFCSRL